MYGGAEHLAVGPDLELIRVRERRFVQSVEMRGHMGLEEVRQKHVVGVDEDHEPTAGMLEPGLKPGHLPLVLGVPDQTESGAGVSADEPLDNLHRRVSGDIVDDDAFEIVVRLLTHRAQARLDVVGVVEARDDDADQRTL